MFKFYLPGWLYRLMPIVYSVAGVITLFSLPNFGGTISGLLLISASVLIFYQRKAYRALKQKQAAEAEALAMASRQKQQININWDPAHEVGNEVIDREHRRLFSLCNDLLNAIMAKKPKGDLELQLDEMLTEIEQHFRTEEEIIGRLAPGLLQAHAEIHRELLERSRNLQQRFEVGQVHASDLIGFIVYDVVSQHIMVEDFKFKSAMST